MNARVDSSIDSRMAAGMDSGIQGNRLLVNGSIQRQRNGFSYEFRDDHRDGFKDEFEERFTDEFRYEFRDGFKHGFR